MFEMVIFGPSMNLSTSYDSIGLFNIVLNWFITIGIASVEFNSIVLYLIYNLQDSNIFIY